MAFNAMLFKNKMLEITSGLVSHYIDRNLSVHVHHGDPLLICNAPLIHLSPTSPGCFYYFYFY